MREGLPQLKRAAGPSRSLWVSHVPYAGRLPVWVPLGLLSLFLAFFVLVYNDLFNERARLAGPALVQSLAADYAKTLPRQISPTVTLLQVQAEGSRLILTHEIKPEALSSRIPARDKASLQSRLHAEACASTAYQALFGEGLSIVLRFQAPSGALLLTSVVSDESCKVAAR